MLFNSDVFLKFFAGFLLLYYLVRDHLAARNILIVLASYVFYGWWDYRFLALLVISSLLDYWVGLGLAKIHSPTRRRTLVALSILGNLSILGFFKYYDFFVDSFRALCQHLNLPFNTQTLGIVLPVGISFYTFQTMSYAIDVYRRQINPTRKLVNFLAYVSFFPQLVAGPIERGRHLLPQFERTRHISREMIEEGVWLMIWGMFKKVVLADNLAPLVDVVYNSSAASPGALIVLGTIAFGFQIYCDFSGYSDIARGTAKILGFDIMINFNLPYFAASLREFWQRWHISLSSWLRDYLYISLGGNRRGRFRTYRNLFLTMLLGGLWHGAAWNFLLWGVWHGSALVLERLALPRPGQKSLSPRTPQPPVRPPGGHALCIRAGTGRTAIEKIREILARLIPIKLTVRASVNLWTLSRLLSWAISMLVVFYGWLLFRAGSLDQILYLTTSLSDFSMPVWIQSYALNLAAFVLPLVLIQLLQYHSANLLAPLAWRPWARGLLQGLLLIGVLIYWEKKGSPFIYFQF